MDSSKNSQDIFKIKELPEELLIHIFDFLNLFDRNTAMLVCKYWFDLLNLTKFSHDCIWIFNDCDIKPGKAPFDVFEKISPRNLHTVEIGGTKIISAMETDTLNFLGFIGKGTTKLIISKSVGAVLSLQRILQYFPQVQHLKCDFSLIGMDFLPPHSLKTIDLGIVPISITLDQFKSIFGLVYNTTLNITIDGTRSVAAMPNSLNFVDYDPQVIDIGIQMSAHTIKVNKLNLREKEKIELADVVNLANDHMIHEKYEPVVSHKRSLQLLTGLKSVSYIFRGDLPDGCWFGHEILQHPSLSNFLLFYVSRPQCTQCRDTFLKSFSNLTEISLCGLEIRFEDVLKSHWKLKKLEIDFTSYPESWAHLPSKAFSKMSTLVELEIRDLADDLTVEMIQKLPKMSHLLRLTLCFDIEWNFENFKLFVQLCPNLRYINISNHSKYTTTQLAMILRLLPYLTAIELNDYDFSDFCLKQFADIISPFARNLRNIDLNNYDADADEGEVYLTDFFDSDDDVKYLLEKIPTLRGMF